MKISSIFSPVRFRVTTWWGLGMSLVLCLMVLAASPNLQAQTLSGINGTVTDSSGSLLPGAKVTVTNNATHVTEQTVTSSAGTFTVTGLNPGAYTVKIEKSGFANSIQNQVYVDAATQSTVNATLKPGSTTETVEVTASPISLETTQPQLGTTIENTVVQDLPLEIGGRGRQIDSFLFLAPGVQGNTFSHNINGGVTFENEVVFNGVPAVQSETQGYQSNINPPFEMVNQFRVMSSVFSAQYGLAQGVASYQFASGTNQLHGDAFEILRNEMFDARGAVNPTTPVDKEHNFGFTLGGPVVIPHLYNGKDRTFFNVSLEWYRMNQGNTSTMTVPTAAMKQGDFSGLVDSSGQVIPIYDPQTGKPFPGNKIDPSRFSSVAKSLLSSIPDPTMPGLTNNLNSQLTSIPTRQASWGFSIDHNLTTTQALHGSFWRDSYSTWGIDNNANFSGLFSGAKREPRLGTGLFLTYTNALTPNLVMTAGFGWMGELNNEFPIQSGVNFPGVVGGTTLPTIYFDGLLSPTTWGPGAGGETQSINRKLGISFDNNYLYVNGRHTLNFGFEVRRAYQDDDECQQCGGYYHFSNLTTGNGSSTAGNAFASFLLGLADSGGRSFAMETRLRNFYIAPYIQDDIKVTPKLTINAGLRWDIMQPFTENDNNIVFFDPNMPNPGADGLLGAATKFGFCPGCAGYTRATTHFKNFGPRLGFAYQWNQQTVLLGGISMTYLNGGAYEFGTSKTAVNYGDWLAGNFVVNSNNSAIPGYGQWDNNPLPQIGATPFSPIMANGQGIHEFSKGDGITPYDEVWNFAVQREMPWNTFFSVAYLGNRAVHLPSQLIVPNQLDPKYLALGNVLGEAWTSADAVAAGVKSPYANFINDFGPNASVAQALRPYPMFTGITNNFDQSGVATYNALQVQGQKRFTNGVSFLVAYTLSRTMSNTDSGFGTFDGTALNSFNQKAEWSVSGNDQTHMLNISTVYELPVGPGKKFLNTRNIAGQILGGWRLSTILTYQSGTPFGIGAPGNPLLAGGNRANLVAGQAINLNYGNVYQGLPVFNTKAFADPGTATASDLWTPGNSPRNVSSLRYPFTPNENMALAKTIQLGERVKGELGIEFFNVFNRVVFCGPDTTVTDPNFGMVTNCQGNTPRQGQANFKISF